MTKKPKIRPIAFVLPQFHPIPENDKWWGEGFTEWTNVTKASPLFKGHYQPQLPTDLGFYDLRLSEAREAQANIAKEHGIYGFCYYHYWFNGKRLLNQPIDEMLRLQKPDMPFMLCWANENWTRRWDGKDEDILIKQEYSFEDDKEHMRWLCEHVFSDERYLKVDACPVFIVYRHNLFPNIKETGKIWRKIAKEEYGFKDLYLCITESYKTKLNPTEISFDASLEFSPHDVIRNKILKKRSVRYLENLRLKKKTNYSLRDFSLAVEQAITREVPKEYKLYRSITPSWDNTARKGLNGTIAVGSSPFLYKKWLTAIIKRFTPYSTNENFIFINAMNEWAEGNHLEPCVKYGRAYLEVTKEVVEEQNKRDCN